MGTRIAIAVDQEGRISRHFGRSASIDFYETNGNGEIRKVAINAVKGPDPGGHDCASNSHGHSEHAQHGHAQWIEILGGCSALICGGMGQRAAFDLKQAGIEPVVTGTDKEPLEAARMYRAGNLPVNTTFCRAHA